MLRFTALLTDANQLPQILYRPIQTGTGQEGQENARSKSHSPNIADSSYHGPFGHARRNTFRR